MKILLLSLLAFMVFVGCGVGDTSSNGSSMVSGHGGSRARFAIAGDYLYTLNQREMTVLDVKDSSAPKKITKIRVPFDVETLFSYKKSLYVGANSGIYIYDISTPTQPLRVSSLTHAQSCDPVVVSNDIAFVTLNSSSGCRLGLMNGLNRLEIVDVREPSNPKFINAIDMYEPSGLAIDNNNLFICDGTNGLRIFDVNRSDNNTTLLVSLKEKEFINEIDCYDVIANNNHLIVSNHKNIRQFNYTSFPMEELGEVR